MTDKTYDADKAIKAQERYCREHDLPHFAPAFDGTCWSCGRNIYRQIADKNGNYTGISVEGAGSQLITGCPHCHHSFVD